jgi:uncharacterized integral membrane protein
MEPEREFMGRKKAKLWTYLIFGTLLVLGVLLANFALVNPDLTRRSVDYFLGLPYWAFPVIVGLIGVLIYMLGLTIETDWPEALGAFVIGGSVAWAEFLIGWDRFVVAGLAVTPYAIPLLTFLGLLMVAMVKSR